MRGDEIGGPIRWRMHIPVPPERVFEALDTDEGRAAFWAESARDLDGKIEFRFINGVKCISKVLEPRPPHIFAIDYMGGLRFLS